jgi:hypothetical protein
MIILSGSFAHRTSFWNAIQKHSWASPWSPVEWFMKKGKTMTIIRFSNRTNSGLLARMNKLMRLRFCCCRLWSFVMNYRCIWNFLSMIKVTICQPARKYVSLIYRKTLPTQPYHSKSQPSRRLFQYLHRASPQWLTCYRYLKPIRSVCVLTNYRSLVVK